MKYKCLRCNKSFIDEELVQIHLYWLHECNYWIIRKGLDNLKQTLREFELDNTYHN